MDVPMMSTSSIALAVVLGGVFLMWAQRLYIVYACGPSMPKGSFGWPVLGETLELFRDPKAFVHSHVKRHGNIFKSHIFLRYSIVGTTPEFAKFVVSNTHIFRRTWPEYYVKIVGGRTFMLQEGPHHTSVRKLAIKAIGVDAVRTQIHAFESIILDSMASWVRTGTVSGIAATQELTCDTSYWILFGDTHSRSTADGIKNFGNFRKLMATTLAVPVNLPVTTYGKGIKARAALIENFIKAIQRLKSQKTAAQGLAPAMLAARDDPDVQQEVKDLDDDAIANNLFLINFAAYDTTSTTLVWILKLLVDNPDVFRRVQAEQQEILKGKDLSVEGPRLTWEDTRKMVYTNKFFQEVQRYLSLVPVAFTEAREDVKFGDYLIPKGWNVVTMSNYIHSDPANYPDLSFNPDRFDVAPKPYSFIPFSAGAHMCPGIEVAKAIAFITIHHLTTTYMYERAGPDKGVEYEGVFLKPSGGYPVALHRRT